MTTAVIVLVIILVILLVCIGFLLRMAFTEYRDMKLSMQQQDRDKMTDAMIRRGMLYNEKHKLRLVKK